MNLARLPHLGLGLSAEYASARKGIDAEHLCKLAPGSIDFLEYGGDLERGLDEHVRRWAESGRATTYHFLDLNLEGQGDATPHWIERTTKAARTIGAAWLCGDGGLWHFGPRDRGQQTLMPPILTRDSALEMADNVMFVEHATGFACLPENPPGTVFLGDLHILDYFGIVAERSQGGLLLDCAHLAIFQHLRGLPALAGLDGFPLDRVVELHIAGGTERTTDGFAWVDDDHGPEPLAETWKILDYVLPRATQLRAVVVECERNPVETVLPFLTAMRQRVPTP